MSIHGSISRLESFVMRNEYLNKVENNSSVCAWSEKTQLKKGDSVTEGYTSELAYVRPATLLNFTKKLVMITGMSEKSAVAHVQQKGDSKCILWTVLRILILTHPDVKKRLLLVWFYSHFRKLEKVHCRVFFEVYSPLKEAVTTPRRDDITKERWMDILYNLREEEVLWKATWMTPNEVLCRCGSFDWVSLPGIWGVIGYAPFSS
ncbi:hypothetical protein CXB51_002141 [Gossypium anomalum]|uniref:DUF7745 domain-containing protein n=1 Tax=Gossypium anomalum TaxID=47600 RepID=A0A8J6DBE1_9ROSI|nr:hypothetical protein CXB51_002141 [Gossypium anomalum]